MQWYTASSSSDSTGTVEEVTSHKLQLCSFQDKTLVENDCVFCLSHPSGKLNLVKSFQKMYNYWRRRNKASDALLGPHEELQQFWPVTPIWFFFSSRIPASCYQQVSQYRLFVIVPLASPSPAKSTGQGWQHSFKCGLLQLYVPPAINQCRSYSKCSVVSDLTYSECSSCFTEHEELTLQSIRWTLIICSLMLL